VVLMHDGGGDRTQTVEALPRILEHLLERGYRFVTIDQLTLRPAGRAETPADGGPRPGA
jgi:peptidoglycan/xylan/chitin deacetylase (PgdA/CDA1 family)